MSFILMLLLLLLCCCLSFSITTIFVKELACAYCYILCRLSNLGTASSISMKNNIIRLNVLLCYSLLSMEPNLSILAVYLPISVYLMLWSQIKLTSYDFSDVHITGELDNRPGTGRFLRIFSCVVTYRTGAVRRLYIKTSASARPGTVRCRTVPCRRC